MSKRKHREKDDEPSPAEQPAKEEAIIADPPKPNGAFVAVTAGLYFVWLLFLGWMALAR